MTTTVSRRGALQTALGLAVGGSGLLSAAAEAQAERAGAPTDRFFRDDWLGAPWRKPETVVLIHGALESSIVWFAWVPALASEYRVLRPDLPGCGLSAVPTGFEWSFPSLARYIASVLDKAGVDAAHVVGAKTGGPIAMQFAADFPARTKSLCVVSGPASVISITNPSPVPQKDRLGSAASAEMIAYWNAMEAAAPQAGTAGLNSALANFDLERDGVLQRIEAPSLIVTADRSALQSVEKVRKYQMAIRNSRLVVVRSDAYHLAVANPAECVAAVLPFIREHS